MRKLTEQEHDQCKILAGTDIGKMVFDGLEYDEMIEVFQRELAVLGATGAEWRIPEDFTDIERIDLMSYQVQKARLLAGKDQT